MPIKHIKYTMEILSESDCYGFACTVFTADHREFASIHFVSPVTMSLCSRNIIENLNIQLMLKPIGAVTRRC